MAITLLRHAPLHPQYQGRYNGWTDLSIDYTQLSSTSVDILTQHPFTHVYSSDLKRCTQTLTYMGITHFTTDPHLREVRFKAHIEGKSFDDITKLNSYDPTLLNDADAWHSFVCAESKEAFERRIYHFLNTLPTEGEILICSHAGTLQKILAILGLARPNIAYLEAIRIEHGIS